MDGLTLLNIYFYVKANSMIHMLRKIPIFQRLISVQIYEFRKAKSIFSIFGVFFDICKMCIQKSIMLFFVYYAVMELLPQYTSNCVTMDGFSILFIFLFCIVPSIYQCHIFKSSQDDFMFLHHFMINPTKYYRYKLVVQLFQQVIAYIPVMIYIWKFDILEIMTLVLVRLGFTLGTMVFYIVFFENKHRIPMVKVRMYTSILLVVAMGVVLLLFGFEIDLSKWFYFISGILSVGISIFSIRYILSYKNFRKIAIQYANKKVVSLHISVSTVVEEDEDGFTGFTSDKNEMYYLANKDKKTEHYLNDTLIYRLGKIIRSHYIENLKLNILLGVVTGFLIRMGILSVTDQNILSYTPVLVTVVSCMVFGHSFCQLCFRNLDLAMLHGGMYKNPEFILSGMRQRYVYILKKDIFTLLSVVCNICLLLIISGIRIKMVSFMFIVVFLAGLILLYETYHFMVYYFIQPYTEDITVSSPIFRVLSGIEGFITFCVLWLRCDITHYAFSVLFVGILFMVLFLTMAKYIVPKNFSIRR